MIRADPVLVDFLSRVLYSVLTLHGVPTAEMHKTTADHAMSANINVLIYENDRGAMVERRHSARKPRHARTDRNEINRVMPLPLDLRSGLVGNQSGSAKTSHGGLSKKISSAKSPALFLIHWLTL